MLAVPMEILPAETTSGDVIGVLQLINAMDDDGEIIPFPEECERIVQALGSLAAVSLRNNQLSRTVYDLLNSFVRVMVDSHQEHGPLRGGLSDLAGACRCTGEDQASHRGTGAVPHEHLAP